MKKAHYMSVLLIAGLLSACSLFVKKSPVSQVQSDAQSDLTAIQSNLQSNTRSAPVTDITKVESGRIGYKKNDISFTLISDPQLNRYQNSSHALFLCIYQLKDPNAFNQLAEEKDGIPKLLECGRFDSSVANSKRVVVQPGQTVTDVRDRAEGTRFIGISAGYFGMDKGKVTSLVPLAVHNGEISGQAISVNLGAYEIDSVKVK